jgi:hypothetical protein
VDDDGPRLVYADWLEEQGDPYGEFIRLQCERFRLPEGEQARRQQLTERLAELQNRHDERWRSRLPRLPGVRWREYRRGFVVGIDVDTADRFLQNAAAIFESAPIEAVWFSALDVDGSAQLADSPYLQKVLVLKNHGVPTRDEGVAALVQSPYISKLRRLFLNGNGLTDVGAESIARSSQLSTLQTLFLTNNQISDAGALALARSTRLPRVREIYLAANPEIRESGIAALRERWGEQAYL